MASRRTAWHVGLAHGWAALTAIALAMAAGAQTPTEVLDDAVPRAEDPERAPLPPMPGAVAPGMLDPAADTTFTLRDVSLSGATVFGEADLSGLWADRLGQPTRLSDIAAITNAVQAFYRGEGYVFTRVLASVEDLEAGRVVLNVVEARIESVTIEEPDGPIGPVLALIERMAAPLEGLANPTLDDLERVLLIMNDVPGITRATAVPRAGTGGPGTLALAINVSRSLVQGAVFFNNRQQPAFGEGLLGGVIEINSYGSAGDSTRLVATTSAWTQARDFNERQIVQLEQFRYVGGSGLRMHLRALYGRSRPGAELEPLALEGSDVEFEIGAEYPAIRTRAVSLWLRGGFGLFDNDLDISGGVARLSEDRRRILFAEAETLLRDRYGFTAGAIGVRQGLGILGASREGEGNLSRFDGDPQATVVHGRIEREQPIASGISAFVSARGQYAMQPLLGGEEFSLGGTSIGRGYDPSEVLGDHGAGLTAELRWRQRTTVAEVPVQVELYGFGDGGRVWNRGEGIPSAATITSFGGGVRAIIANDTFVNLEVAKPTQRLQRTNSNAPRLFLTAQRRF